MSHDLGITHFITQIDTVGKVVFGLLIVLSLASWYLIVLKTIENWLEASRAKRFIERFQQHPSIDTLSKHLNKENRKNAFSQLAEKGLASVDYANNQGAQKLASAGGFSEFVTRAIRNELDQESAHSEKGLTILATTGSISPYIGLFGTVWAIYHALINIGLSGQGSLDKVAGPVGEALIMTAIGLAVAIPAVFAYNAFNRRNRQWLAKLDAFAHDLFVILTVNTTANVSSVPKQRSTS